MIYIQSDSDRKIPHHVDAALAMYGAIETGQDYRLTSMDEISSGKFDLALKLNRNMCVGSVDFMQECFNRLDIDRHKIKLPIPTIHRHKILRLKDVLSLIDSGESIFVKSVDTKLFSGIVIDGTFNSRNMFNSMNPNTKFYVLKPYKSPIVSEWRTYIHNNNIVDIKCYSGDPFRIPSLKYVKSVLNTCIRLKFPIAYTIDVAVLEDKSFKTVEFNDFWAIGNYGLDNSTYIRMLRDRYDEITK